MRYLQHLDRLARHIGEKDYEDHKVFLELLKKMASIVHKADNANAPDLPQIIERAAEIFDEAVNWAYGTQGDYDFLPSYAHCLDNQLMKDNRVINLPGGKQMSMDVLALYDEAKHLIHALGPPNPAFDAAIDAQRPKPWPESPHPHPKTTRLSRFREGITPSFTDATLLARTIYQARCEVAADIVTTPVSAAISADCSALALVGAGGWKNRDPTLTIYYLDEPAAANADEDQDEGGEEIRAYGGFRRMALEPGLADVAHDVAIDNTHRLALIADSDRIKTFAWGGNVAFGGWTPARGTNVHTMDSNGYDGPVAVLPGGRIARAGRGGVAIWNIDGLVTHEGGRRVGRKLNLDGVWRDHDDDEIERSTGSKPSTTVTFAQTGLRPAVWHHHDLTGHMLSAESSAKSQKYGSYSLDLGAGGKIAARFLGHGGNVTAFATSAGDANVFLTGCADGYARLYDVRHPLPVMTIDSGRSHEFCVAVEFVHPDGIPTVFTGGDHYQNVMTWDVRARALVYELATGNTAVRTLTWDERHATLYAGTENEYMDRHGNTYDYRGARIAPWAYQTPLEPRVRGEGGEDDEMDDDEEEGEDSDDDWDEHEQCWPKRAAHDEKAFGYAYDAGEHVFLRYKFKEDADPTMLPEYGQAQMERDEYRW